MTALSLDCGIVPRYRTSGWLVSVAVHGMVAGGAVLLMTDLHLASQPEPFRWQASVAPPRQSKAPKFLRHPNQLRPRHRRSHNLLNAFRNRVLRLSSVSSRIRHVTQAVQAVTPTTHQEIRKAEQVVHPERTPIEAVPSQPAITREMQSLNKTAETTFGRLRSLPPHQLQNPLQASPSRVQRKRVPL